MDRGRWAWDGPAGIMGFQQAEQLTADQGWDLTSTDKGHLSRAESGISL